MTTYTVATYAERPDLIDKSDSINPLAWPEFMLNDAVANRLWDRLASDLPQYQFMLLGPDDTIIANGNSIPFVWDGAHDSLPDNGWDWVMQAGFDALDRGETPTAVSALSITIPHANRGQGISRQMVTAMRDIARSHGFSDLVAPVRPNEKHFYPLTPIERYAVWTNADGSPFDAWMRVHWRLGAQVVRPCPQSMLIESSVADWEDWTKMRFPDSGDYIVPGALVPVRIDRAADVGRYVEPNVWMHHRLRDAAP